MNPYLFIIYIIVIIGFINALYTKNIILLIITGCAMVIGILAYIRREKKENGLESFRKKRFG
jgi:hypothetical protein